jgi:glycosyltransferase involved in cell wall biosynthesis
VKIGFDAKYAFNHLDAHGKYSRNVIEMMLQYFPANEYYLFTPKRAIKSHLIHEEQANIIKPQGLPHKLVKEYWRKTSIVKGLAKDGIQVYHGLVNYLPGGLSELGIKGVVTIHRPDFIGEPEQLVPEKMALHAEQIQKICHRADKIVVLNEQTKADLIQNHFQDEKKIKLVHEGCDPFFNQAVDEEFKKRIREKYKLPERFILFSGAIEPRNNLLNIIKALHQYAIDIPLTIIVDKPTGHLQKIVKYISTHLIENIHFIQKISLDEAPALYQMAEAFLYPSSYQGYSTPVWEALQSHTPVITSDTCCFKEIDKKGALFINPENIEKLAASINKLLNNSKLRKELIKKGDLQVKKHDQQQLASQLMKIYQELIS